MRNFLCVSLFLILPFSCSPPKQSTRIDPVTGTPVSPAPCFSGTFEKALYKASLDIKKQHMSGFLLIKKTADSIFRIVFANEIGMTLFDFELQVNQFKVHYIFEPMNRKILLHLFEKDFRQLIFNITPGNSNPVMKMQFQSEGQEGEAPRKIAIINPGIKMNLELRLISQ